MTSVDFESGARAAGAVAFAIELDRGGQIRFTGALEAFGLQRATFDWSGFCDRLGPADHARLDAALGGDRLDLRIRLIGETGSVAYVRLLGRRVTEQRFEGLMTPAGLSGEGALRIREEHALANAVAAGEVIAWYQPIIALATGRLAGFEALARWERPGVGVLAPQDFLAMADDLDLLDRISTEVRASAIADLSLWRTVCEGGSELFVAANATVSELVSPSFPDALLEAVRQAQLPAGAFKLEIAETEIMRDPDLAAGVMARLSAGGIALALDDFGTGYSSLARLEMLPFDVVKIDRYFVRAMAANESAGTVVQSVIQLARHFGMKIVAEGIESAESGDGLRAMGCDFGQGYRYAGALAPDQALLAVRHGLEGRFLPPA
ncbi:EAL domain-containing protein [Maricaulis salignorans]|uniref:EAL domain, c-di-GMP-specific phosphodiesterase class I (Or its enzymatically inactive variant) n=1 Tax=Maricaulis salignorans TaxID=144026 RepID=A0A1G9RJP8_9PROT|nr:EAL domain-containing protein [Maricaulis salignorans]SDM22655.1 EAL domain, c-di-GMP-specific phosphodiesterase class I (or its enzymatically inactive variant) [Maricaulis salignorans]